MRRQPTSVRVLSCLLAAVMLVLMSPLPAMACPIPIRKIGPLKIRKQDLRKPIDRATTLEAWRLADAGWVSTRPRLSQFVRIRGVGTYHGRSYRTQRALSIDAYSPEDRGWLFYDDGDSATSYCELAGKALWERPRIRVKQGKYAVRVLAYTREITGDRTGCEYGPDEGIAECPTLARSILRLKQPLGNRKLIFEQIAGRSAK